MNVHGWKFMEKKSEMFKKTKWKKKVLKKIIEKEKKRSRSVIWDLLCKVGGIDVIWKVKLSSTSL